MVFRVYCGACQELSNCNVVEWTLDDLNSYTPQNSFDFGSLIENNCGCNQSGLSASNCVLIKLTLAKTVNGQLYEHDCSKLLYSGGWFPGRPGTFNTPHNFVDIYNASNCGKYLPQGINSPHEDIFQIPLNTSPGEIVELLVCQGSNPSPMKGYFNQMDWCTNTGNVYQLDTSPEDNNSDEMPPSSKCCQCCKDLEKENQILLTQLSRCCERNPRCCKKPGPQPSILSQGKPKPSVGSSEEECCRCCKDLEKENKDLKRRFNKCCKIEPKPSIKYPLKK